MSEIEVLTRNDDIVRGLYRSVFSCADHHKGDMISRIHISTPIEDKIIHAANLGKVVIITGNPGDGKTHMIRKIEGEKAFPKKTIINVDANESEDEEVISSISDALSGKKPLILAINEGILLDICEKARKRHVWPDHVIESILKPYVYEETREEHDRICMLDLNLRNNLSRPVVEQALDKILSLAGDDESSPYLENIKRLTDPTVRDRLIRLLDAVAQTGAHATMRELLGFMAYLLCGGEDETKDGKPNPYYMNAFDGGIGSLFDKIREYDPLQMPSPFLDYRLFTSEDQEEEWIYTPPYEMRTQEDVAVFRTRKRRAYFEHNDGENILRRERSEVERSFEKLKKRDQSPENVAANLLNRFFDSKIDQTDQLILWFNHQFSARTVRYVASSHAVGVSEFEILIPQLPVYLQKVFSDHYPDHVIFKHKKMKLSDGLVIDRRFLEMLIAGDRITGLGSRNQEAHAKITSFYDRLSKICGNHLKTVQIMRLDNLSKVKIGVDVAEHTYFIPGV